MQIMNSFMFVPLMVAVAACSPMTSESSTTDQSAMSMEEMVQQCNTTYRIDAKYLEELNKTGKFPDETDQTPMCFIHCLFDKSGMMDAKGDFNVDHIQMVFKNFENGTEIPDAKEMIDNCLSERSEYDICEKSYGLSKCLITEQIKKARESEDSKAPQDKMGGKN